MSRLSRLGRLIIFISVTIISLCLTSFSPLQSTTKNVAVIFLKHDEPYCTEDPNSCKPWWGPDEQALILPPRHSAAAYEAVLNNLISSYYSAASFGQISLHFDTLVNPDDEDGWFTAPHKIWEYNQNLASLHTDGVATAYDFLGSALEDYDMLMIVQQYQGRAGQGCGHGNAPYFGPKMCDENIGSTVVNIQEFYVGEDATDRLMAAIASHEIGHLLGLPDQYASGTINSWPAMGPWDIMGNDTYFNHMGAYSKWLLDWIPAVTDIPCLTGECEITTDITPLETPGNNVLRIPFTTDPFSGYMVECRRKMNKDENIPEEGVLVTSIDPYRPIGVTTAQVVTSSGADFLTAALAPGETYTDPVSKVTVTYLSDTSSGACKVKAFRGEVKAPDPSIKKGSSEASSGGYTAYTSPDIWIDSQENGWDVYPQGESFTYQAGVSVPTGFGDPFWVDHENRIHFLVHNTGNEDASNVTVEIRVTQPLVLNIPGANCNGPVPGRAKTLATVVIPDLPAGGDYHGSVLWTPTKNVSARVTVVIHEYEGELTPYNNSASETYMAKHFVVGMVDNIQAVIEALPQGSLALSGDTATNCPVDNLYLFRRREYYWDRKYWVMDTLTPAVQVLEGVSQELGLASMQPTDVKTGECRQVTLELSALVNDVYVPVDGITYETCAVEQAAARCQAPVDMLELGQCVPISGVLSPDGGRQRVALEYTAPNGQVIIRNANTRRNGTFEDIFLPEQAGTWTVQIHYQGSRSLTPAFSSLCMFSIKSPNPQFTLDQNSKCRQGPGTDYEVVTYGTIGQVLLADARTDDGSWIYGRLNNLACWIYSGLGTYNGDLYDLPVKQPPAAPIWVVTEPPFTPTVVIKPPIEVLDSCRAYTTQAVCRRYEKICKWVQTSPLTGAGTCVHK